MPQGTIKFFNAESRTGIILDDAKQELPFASESFAASGLREFRLGQRVKFDVEGQPPGQRVLNLTIVSL